MAMSQKLLGPKIHPASLLLFGEPILFGRILVKIEEILHECGTYPGF